MKIAICGCGVVGRATGEGFARLGHDIFTYDINPEAARVPWGKPLSEPESPKGCAVVFFCTPEEAATDAVIGWSGPGVRVMRSSTSPGTVARLAKEYLLQVCHNPEFLREAVALHDFLNPNYVLLGFPKGFPWVHRAPLLSLYEPFQAPIVQTDSTTSEMVKMATNGLLASLIAFWNDIGRLCQALGISSHEVGMIANRDPRVPAYGARQHGQPYGGHCLPKDIRHLLALAERHLGPDVHGEVPVLSGVSKWAA